MKPLSVIKLVVSLVLFTNDSLHVSFPNLVSVLSRKHYFCGARIKKILYFPSQKVRTSYFTGLFDVVMFC